jgi:hypothetical protein
MNAVDVHNQQELAAALADGAARINLRGDARFTITDTGSSRVEAMDSSHVEAWDSSHVEAWGSSHVVARDSSHVVAWGSSHVEAWGSSHVVAGGSSHVVAGSHVPIQKHHRHVGTIEGGVLIELPNPETQTPDEWAAYQGVKVSDGHVVLFKAVDDRWHPWLTKEVCYEPGTTVVAEDFADGRRCGGGLHFGVTPAHARMYHQQATRFVACRVKLDGLVPLDDKAKARSCEVLYEVDIDGQRIGGAS